MGRFEISSGERRQLFLVPIPPSVACEGNALLPLRCDLLADAQETLLGDRTYGRIRCWIGQTEAWHDATKEYRLRFVKTVPSH